MTVDYMENPFVVAIAILALLVLIAMAFILKLMVDNTEAKKLLEEEQKKVQASLKQKILMADKIEILNNDLLITREKRVEDLKKVVVLEQEVLRKEGVIQMQKQSMDADAKKAKPKRPPAGTV